MNLPLRIPALSLALATLMTATSGLAAIAADYSMSDQHADITALCGTKPISIALVDGFGADTWRKITRAEFQDEVAKCPNVEQVLYFGFPGRPAEVQL